MENLDVTRIDRADTLGEMVRSEIDIQIATAKRWPRNVGDGLKAVVAMATSTPQVANECFYSLRRGGSGGEGAAIEGPSVRLAEIVAASWGNLRVSSQIVGNDGRFITARGMCLDLETNVAVSYDVKRRITDKAGRTYSDDMQVVTGNAAGAIAFRNAVFKVVPKAVIGAAIEEIKKALRKDTEENFEETKAKMFAAFAMKGVTRDMILGYFGKTAGGDVTMDEVVELRTTFTAINEGQASAEELFIKPWREKTAGAKAAGKGVTNVLARAMAAQDGMEAGK